MTQKELLQTQIFPDAPESPNETEEINIVHENIEGTPFYIVGNIKNGYRLILGKWALTDPYETIEQVREALQKEQWKITLSMIVTVLEELKPIESKIEYYKDNQKTTL